MEASTLFILAAAASGPPSPLGGEGWRSDCQAGAVMAVFATDDPERDFVPEVAQESERRAIRVALAALGAWADDDRGGR